MALTDEEIKSAKVPYGRNQYKISDGGGLYILVKSSGQYWKLAYRFDGKQKSLALGVYPNVTIDEARTKRDEAKAMLAEGIDPGEVKKQEKLERREEIAAVANSSTKSSIKRPAALSAHDQSVLEERRLVILNLLAATGSYTINEEQLLNALHERDCRISFDRLRTDLAWLSEQDAVQLKLGPLWGVYLTQYGLDAVDGRLWIPGIKRLQPD